MYSQENSSTNSLKPRRATRTVLLDKTGQVAIIYVQKHGYYKIPGGGIENGEDVDSAAKREVLEEAGCKCTIVGKLGQLETAIPVWDLLDISEGFVALVSGEKNAPNYEDWESQRGFELKWFKNLDSAIATIKENQNAEPGMVSMQSRDLTFLRLAREKINSKETKL